ncbi:MAG: heme-binding protein [Limnobacter sp.]|nr:heme-binding protein [Limnobacter sp.]
MKKRVWVAGAVIALVLVALASVGPLMSDVEQPEYDVLSSDEPFEIRQYEPMIIAKVEVQGEREEAIGQGFRKLADYIFGNNTVQKDIAMTAPVQQQAAKVNQEISMTAPVQQQQAENGQWTISFVMPSKYTLTSLPTPNNAEVQLQRVPGKRFAAIVFSGNNSQDNVAKHEAKLLQYIQNSGLRAVGPPKYAFYNPPWTLPFMRRNEVMVELEE